MRVGYLRVAGSNTVMDVQYDVLVWQEADGWHWCVIAVRAGRDAERVAHGGPEATQDRAAAAGEARKPT